MNAIDLLALLSFLTMVVAWAVLPANGFAQKREPEEPSTVKLRPVQDKR